MDAIESNRRPNGVRSAVRRREDVEKSSSPLNANSHLERGEMDASFKSRIFNPDGEVQGAGAHRTDDDSNFQSHIQKRLQSRRGFSSSETRLVCFRMNRHEVNSQFEKADNSIGLDRSRGTRPSLHSTCLR